MEVKKWWGEVKDAVAWGIMGSYWSYIEAGLPQVYEDVVVLRKKRKGVEEERVTVILPQKKRWC